MWFTKEGCRFGTKIQKLLPLLLLLSECLNITTSIFLRSDHLRLHCLQPSSPSARVWFSKHPAKSCARKGGKKNVASLNHPIVFMCTHQSRHTVELSDDVCELINVSFLNGRDELLQEFVFPCSGESDVEVFVSLHGSFHGLHVRRAQMANACLEEVALHAVLEQIVVHRLFRNILEKPDGLGVSLKFRIDRRHLQLALVRLRVLILRLEKVHRSLVEC
mmetsp:Transcript_1891/g.4307  ORF Transcript_1891/g.4307 Transcript_1891/m.4307 type:complete len:219 (+) Transcript_1891:116-772(+)